MIELQIQWANRVIGTALINDQGTVIGEIEPEYLLTLHEMALCNLPVKFGFTPIPAEPA